MRGKRCSYSDEGKATFTMSAKLERHGTVVGESWDKTCWAVLWDGRKSQESIHKSYVTILD